MANSDEGAGPSGASGDGAGFYVYLTVLLVAAAVYAGCMISPPSLMDDVDAAQAQVARNMLTSGDWVTARLDGVPYPGKAPLLYWLIAESFQHFGVADWVARIPVVFAALALAWLTTAFGTWAFGARAGLYAGLCISTCFGLFLFTRILIPDVMLAGSIALSMWAFLRAIDNDEKSPGWWAFVMAASLGASLLLKSLIGMVFPIGAALIYLAITRQLFNRKVWKALHPLTGVIVIVLIAAPWHILAAWRNPQQLLRFLNLRNPRDYDTVPRLYFWLFQLLWLFPWSVYFPAVFGLNFKPSDRAGRARLLAVCWTGFILVFLTFPATREYDSMPCYPALALLLGSAMAAGGNWIRYGTRVLCALLVLGAGAALTLCFLSWNLPTPGDISAALSSNSGAWKLSIASFAYLRLPLLVAALAFLLGAAGTRRSRGSSAFLSLVLMCVVFFHAARLAMARFDPYLSSRPLAEALLGSPQGKLIVDHDYYTLSSIFFYTNRTALLLNGRFPVPGAPNVIDDMQWKTFWLQPDRYYLVITQKAAGRLNTLVEPAALTIVAQSGGKLLLTNHKVQ